MPALGIDLLIARKFVSDVFSNFPCKEKLLRDIPAEQVCHVMETPGVYQFVNKKIQ
jgi:hypothetical protein